MANRTLFRQFDLPEEELRQELGDTFDGLLGRLEAAFDPKGCGNGCK